MNSLSPEEIKELQRIAMMNAARIEQEKSHDSKGRPIITYRPKVVDYGEDNEQQSIDDTEER